MIFNGQKIAKFRRQAKVSLARLSLKTYDAGRHISAQTLSNWEKGKSQPRADELKILSNIFDKKITEFYSEGSASC